MRIEFLSHIVTWHYYCDSCPSEVKKRRTYRVDNAVATDLLLKLLVLKTGKVVVFIQPLLNQSCLLLRQYSFLRTAVRLHGLHHAGVSE